MNKLHAWKRMWYRPGNGVMVVTMSIATVCAQKQCRAMKRQPYCRFFACLQQITCLIVFIMWMTASYGYHDVDCDPQYCSLYEQTLGSYEEEPNPPVECRKWVTVIKDTWDCPKQMPDGSTIAGPGRFKQLLKGWWKDQYETRKVWCERDSPNPYADCDDHIWVGNIKVGGYCDTEDAWVLEEEFIECIIE